MEPFQHELEKRNTDKQRKLKRYNLQGSGSAALFGTHLQCQGMRSQETQCVLREKLKAEGY